jgi:hypothetical protein
MRARERVRAALAHRSGPLLALELRLYRTDRFVAAATGVTTSREFVLNPRGEAFR